MREGPAAEREPRGEAIDAVRAFFRDAGVEKALTPMDPVREMATNAGNAAAAVAAARERNARTTWAPMNDKGTLLDDEGDLEEEDVGGGGKTTIQALRAMVREARTQLASTQKQLEVAMIGTDEGTGTGDRDVDKGKN